ncbi:MAG: hypothetical protein AAFY34_09775 [Pseudomonadota bacterium]
MEVSDKQLLDHVLRVQIPEAHLELTMAAPFDQATLMITAPYTFRRRGVETRLLLQTSTERDPDPVLAKRILRAMNWVDQIKSGVLASEVAAHESVSSEYISHNLHFGFLSPQILDAVLTGRLPPHLSTKAITRMRGFPTEWSAQNELLLR